VHPSSWADLGNGARQIQTPGADRVDFFMVFLRSIAAVMVFALTGVQFETAWVLSVAALSTTGPWPVLITAESPSVCGHTW
jgi:trk system potassium uptake protein TrkH